MLALEELGLSIDGESLRASLVALLAEAVERVVDSVHVEPADGRWRVRHRHDHGLLESVLDESDPLPRALLALRDALLTGAPSDEGEHQAFTARLGGGPWLIELRTIPASGGESFLLKLVGHALVPPRLDELCVDAGQLSALRALLRRYAPAPSGDDVHGPVPRRAAWLPVAAADESGGARIVRAIAQELAAPDVKLLCLEPRYHPPLARVAQIHAPHGDVDLSDLDPDVVLLAATPDDDVLRALGARAAENLLVVQRCTARRPSELLRRLLALGLTPVWIALCVPALIVRYRVRTVCVHCRVAAPADCDEAHWLATTPAPRVHDVASWLERSLQVRFQAGDGCPPCHGTGHDGVRELFDIVALDTDTRAALHRGDIDVALLRVDTARTLATRLHAMVGRGEITAAEAARHLRERY